MSLNVWKEGVYCIGYLFKLLGILEGNICMVRVIVEVFDLLVLKVENIGKFWLMIGVFLEVYLEGEVMDSVVCFNCDMLWEDEIVWVM